MESSHQLPPVNIITEQRQNSEKGSKEVGDREGGNLWYPEEAERGGWCAAPC